MSSAKTSVLLAGGRLIDPSQGIDRAADLLLSDGVVTAIDPSAEQRDRATQSSDWRRVDCQGMIVAPGLIDVGTELGEPGREEDEQIATGLAAAVRGGFTTLIASPFTSPPIDTAAAVQFVSQQAARCCLAQVYSLATVSKARQGRELAELGSLFEAGAIGFTDGPTSIENTDLLRRALEYCLMFDRPIIEYPDNQSISRGGVMHEDLTQLILGLSPLPAEAEDLATARNLRLVESTGGRLHLAAISTSGSVEIARRMRDRGIQFTTGVSVANCYLTDERLRTFDPNYKVMPPLRSRSHVDAVRRGLADGTIDMIHSGHRPLATEKKIQELDAAPFGMIALETMLGEVATHLVNEGVIDWPQVIAAASTRPAALFGLPGGSLAVGRPADVVVIDPELRWTYDVAEGASQARNSPLDGQEFIGGVTSTWVAGRPVYER